MAEDPHFVGKAFFGLWSSKRLVHPAIVADANLCPERVLDVVHASGNMTHEGVQASLEAKVVQGRFSSPERVAEVDDFSPHVRSGDRIFKIILLANGMIPAFVSDTPGREYGTKEINRMR
jgi:hypothetical protein